jgi:hypothetical protein
MRAENCPKNVEQEKARGVPIDLEQKVSLVQHEPDKESRESAIQEEINVQDGEEKSFEVSPHRTQFAKDIAAVPERLHELGN